MLVQVENKGFTTELTSDHTVHEETDTISLTAKSNFGDRIELIHNMRSLAVKRTRDAEFKIPAKLLGRGPVSLEAIAIDEAGSAVASFPVQLTITGQLSEQRPTTNGK